ncbi:hypothetical protein AB1Y20_012981 [Prymnesium parvum]|uniref:BPL/LPL catalytic domain-containing protein n=1 Tax=Prymnesium parvum TaxID=97485 RepID=A0AB34IM61_PRYPA
MARLLRLRNVPILDALRLEEALFRADRHSWIITNEWDSDGGKCSLSGKLRSAAESVAVVLGISGTPEELVHTARAAADGVPLIKRFSGGGTVVVDSSTLFVTFIVAEGALDGVSPYPDPILNWTSEVYSDALARCGVAGFATHANDYCIGNRKFGGNAQSISGKRWLHHTSLLWDYEPARMALLQMPTRRPEYRANRSHEEFICSLSSSCEASRATVVDAIVAAACERLGCHEVDVAEASSALRTSHRKVTTILQP